MQRYILTTRYASPPAMEVEWILFSCKLKIVRAFVKKVFIILIMSYDVSNSGIARGDGYWT